MFTFEYPFTKVELNSARHYLAGRSVIYRPYIPIVVIGRPKKLQARGPRRALQMNTVLDSGADVCMFPEWVAHCLDLAADLQSAPVDRFSRVADEGAVVEARILEVVLEITHPENREFGFHQWSARVGFVKGLTKISDSLGIIGNHDGIDQFRVVFSPDPDPASGSFGLEPIRPTAQPPVPWKPVVRDHDPFDC